LIILPFGVTAFVADSFYMLTMMLASTIALPSTNLFSLKQLLKNVPNGLMKMMGATGKL
jgi:hypothetical protein